MTNEEINRAVAESVGWRFVSVGCDGLTDVAWLPPGALESITAFDACGSHPPDYCNDVNAMHEVVCKLPDGEPWDCFLRELQIVTQTWDHIDAEGDEVAWFWELATATARQRAEAYLRTIGKWRDA
jgi:hypothetical protein